jgi:hypothetical protein
MNADSKIFGGLLAIQTDEAICVYPRSSAVSKLNHD